MLNYSLHAAGSPRRRRKPVGHLDSSPHSSSDPTGTTPIIKGLNKSLGMAWQEVKKEVRRVVGEADSFGLSQGIGGTPALAASGGQVHAFQTWLEGSQFRVLGEQRGALEKGVGYGYAKGVSDAQARAGKTLLEPLPGSSVILESAILDLYGISQAVLQQATRMFSDVLLKKSKPLKLSRNLALLVDKVGVQRSMQLSHYAVVRAHATGTLDTLQALNINMVGVIPERALGKVTKDAVELGKVSLRVPPLFRKTKPSEIARAYSVEKRLEKIGEMVNVVNASNPCPICVAIAEDGPYTIDQARGLIPRHPNCQCAFVPA